MDLHKFAQEAVRQVTWTQVAKKKGLQFNDYLARIKQTTDKQMLSQLSRMTGSYKGFGGVALSGFQRKMISAAARQRLQALGYVNALQVKTEPL